jgi:hypothetical protein
MTIEEIRFEMNINDVKESDIDEIIDECKTSGFSVEHLDEELQKRGYRKIFSIDYDDMDTYNEEAWEDFE